MTVSQSEASITFSGGCPSPYRLYLNTTLWGVTQRMPSLQAPTTVRCNRSLGVTAVWLDRTVAMCPIARWILLWKGSAAPVPLVRGLGVAAQRSAVTCTHSPLFARGRCVSTLDFTCSRLRSMIRFFDSTAMTSLRENAARVECYKPLRCKIYCSLSLPTISQWLSTIQWRS